MAINKRVDPLALLFPSLYEKHKWLFPSLIVMWLILGVSWFFYTRKTYPVTSPFVSIESWAETFQMDIGWGTYDVAAWDGDPTYFRLYRDPVIHEIGFQYANPFLKEKIIYFQVINETGIFYKRDFPWEKMPSDRIIDYWVQSFRVSPEKEFFSVCYRFRSGAVLQVADLYEIYGKPADAVRPHRYRVVRMFFVGTKYKKYFPHAYFETEANIQHYKQLMKEGKGWVQQANRYINEKEVKKEKPILDYRTNPDYYKPLSQRRK